MRAFVQRYRTAAFLSALMMCCGRAESPATPAQEQATPPASQPAQTASKTPPGQPSWDPGFGEAPVGYLEILPPQTRRGESLKVVGWAVDKKDGAPVQSITLYVDDHVAAKASLGFPRPDVSDSLARPDMRRAGWMAAVDTARLSVGTHQIRAVAVDSEGHSAELRPIPKPVFEVQ